ncbi:MAG: hypothetical protein ACRD09_06380 [Vicinamibacterales bacterium]
MKQRWAMFAIGMWIAGSLIIFVVATQNFRTIDRLLTESTNAAFSSQVSAIGQPASRDLLRYLSSELNRLYFQLWNAVQVPLGLLALWLLSGRPSAAKARWGVVGMLGIVALMAVWLQPEITSIGRSLDFVPRNPPPPALGRFWMLHGVYTVLEACKLVVGIIVAVWIGRAGGASGV